MSKILTAQFKDQKNSLFQLQQVFVNFLHGLLEDFPYENHQKNQKKLQQITQSIKEYLDFFTYCVYLVTLLLQIFNIESFESYNTEHFQIFSTQTILLLSNTNLFTYSSFKPILELIQANFSLQQAKLDYIYKSSPKNLGASEANRILEMIHNSTAPIHKISVIAKCIEEIIKKSNKKVMDAEDFINEIISIILETQIEGLYYQLQIIEFGLPKHVLNSLYGYALLLFLSSVERIIGRDF